MRGREKAGRNRATWCLSSGDHLKNGSSRLAAEVRTQYRKSMTLARIAVVALLSAAAIPAQTTVEGMVIDRFTRGGIPGVQVTLNLRRGVRYQTVTDNSGGFRIPDM